MKTLNRLLMIACFMTLTASVNAQPDFTDDVQDAPIDGGISIMIGAGIYYGIKKLKQDQQD